MAAMRHFKVGESTVDQTSEQSVTAGEFPETSMDLSVKEEIASEMRPLASMISHERRFLSRYAPHLIACHSESFSL
jgi:hypothetical protein